MPSRDTFHFPGGLKDYLDGTLDKQGRVTSQIFAGRTEKVSGHGAVEWAVSWTADDGFVRSYCNTIPTPEGGTHEAGLRSVLLRETGITEVIFTIHRDGDITNLRLARSSGSNLLDAVAMNAIKASKPLPRLPEDFPRDVVNAKFSFEVYSR